MASVATAAVVYSAAARMELAGEDKLLTLQARTSAGLRPRGAADFGRLLVGRARNRERCSNLLLLPTMFSHPTHPLSLPQPPVSNSTSDTRAPAQRAETHDDSASARTHSPTSPPAHLTHPTHTHPAIPMAHKSFRPPTSEPPPAPPTSPPEGVANARSRFPHIRRWSAGPVRHGA